MPEAPKTEENGLKLLRRGKVRDVYDLGTELLLVASDRVSAFDHVLPTPIPGKGEILTRLSGFWFKETAGIVSNHMIAWDWDDITARRPELKTLPPGDFAGRSMLVRKAQRFDAECVARGYLAGSGWGEYQASGQVCGHRLPSGLTQSARLRQPLFTPAAKADAGHDLNIPRERLAELIGGERAAELERLTLALYEFASLRLANAGLILADTKFEFGLIDGRVALIDEALTPDSSRIWEASAWRPGGAPPNFDKQFLRDHLEQSGWDKNPPAPALPDAIVSELSARYRRALERITS